MDLALRRTSPLIVLAALLALVVLLSPELGKAGGSGPSVALKASQDEILMGKSSRLRGTLSGASMGNDGRTVQLVASPFPYETSSVVDSATTDANGDFEFMVSPELNTRYRATFDGGILGGTAQSSPEQVFVFPKFDYDLGVTDRGFAKARFDFFYSEQVQPEYYVGKRKLNWYFRKTSQDRLRRVATTRFEDTAQGVGGDLTYKLPRSRKSYRFEIVVCADAPARDIGTGNDKRLRCPRSFRVRGREAALSRPYSP